MANGTASETNGITRGTNGDGPLSCPFCGCGMKVEVYQYIHIWYRVVPTENHAEGCFLRGVQHRRFRAKEAAIASWNTRADGKEANDD